MVVAFPHLSSLSWLKEPILLFWRQHYISYRFSVLLRACIAVIELSCPSWHRRMYEAYQPDASLLKGAANDFRVASGSILGRIPEMKRHAPAAPRTRAPKPTTRLSGYPVQRQRRQASKETRAIRVSQAKFAQVALPLAGVI
jgi:hypothetical protein